MKLAQQLVNYIDELYGLKSGITWVKRMKPEDRVKAAKAIAYLRTLIVVPQASEPKIE